MITQLRKKHLILTFLISICVISKGQTWQWAKDGMYSGIGSGEGTSVCNDKNGNVIITGEFGASAISFGAYTLTSAGGQDLYLVKYDPNGNVLWAKNAVCTGDEWGYGVYCDTAGNVYLTGRFTATSIAFGTNTLTGSGGQDFFIAKYDVNGNALWAKTAVGTMDDLGSSVSTDPAGNAYVTGYYHSPTLAFGTNTITNSGNYSCFITKYDANGNVIWAKSSVGSALDRSYGISTDQAGNSYITGGFGSGTISFGTNTLTNAGNYNMFIVKYDANGTAAWAKSGMGSGSDFGNWISCDLNGNVYVTGNFYSPIISFSANTLTNTGASDAFIVKYDANGNVLWAKNPVGSNIEIGYSISATSSYIFVAGRFDGPTITLGTYTITTPAGSTDPMFIAKYDINGNVVYATTLTSGGDDLLGISTDKNCNAYVTGDFIGNSIDSLCVIGTFTLPSTMPPPYENIYVAKLFFPCQVDDVRQLQPTKNDLLIFPNPNNGSFDLEIENETESAAITLMNSLGQKVHEEKVKRGLNKINTNGIAKGLYTYILFQDNQKVKEGKIIVD